MEGVAIEAGIVGRCGRKVAIDMEKYAVTELTAGGGASNDVDGAKCWSGGGNAVVGTT